MTDSATGPDVPEETRSLLDRFGFEEGTFNELRERLRSGADLTAENIIQGNVTPLEPSDSTKLPARGTPERERLAALGDAAIKRGEVGCVVLAGGMATRFGGVVKAVVEVFDGHSFLDLKLRDIQAAAERAGGVVPTYLMTSFATHAEIEKLAKAASTERVPTEAFKQFISLRLEPDGELFHDDAGQPSPYAPGHGDLSFALRKAGVLERFRNAGGKLLYMSNVDNLAATLDPAVIGAHLESNAKVSVEVAPKAPGDKGGAPARVDGDLQVVETFRFPPDFDQDTIPVFNTNSFVLDAESIDRDFDLSWFVVKKKVDEREAIQFERLVGELTAFLPTHCIEVEREGDDGRFAPIKNPPDLDALKDEIKQMLKARGSL